jgi:hypothetical protein
MSNEANQVLNNIDPIAAMRMGVSYSHSISVRNFSCKMRPLSIQETIDVTNAVIDEMATMEEVKKTRLEEHTLIAIHTLVRASMPNPDSGFESAKLQAITLRKMTNDEVHALYNEYVAVTDKVNPSLDEMTTEEIKELVEAVKKNHSAVTGYSFWQLAKAVKYFVTKEESQVDK